MIGIDQIERLFNPSGVIVIGASTHPGKFGFVALHNVLNAGFEGPVLATNPQKPEILGVQSHAEVKDMPSGMADFAMICVSPDKVIPILPELATIGVKTAFVVSGGFREVGEIGAKLEKEMLRVASDCGILIAGPNGQGLISTPADLCSQIVSPYPPKGNISIASQSGNILSAFMNLSRNANIGIARGISTGNQGMVSIADYLRYFGDDDETSVIVTYIEGIPDGRAFYNALSGTVKEKPVIVIRGGSTKSGASAAKSHTGSLASDHAIFTAMINQAGAFLASDVEHAFELAATFATQPLPKGNKVFVMTTAGGWGVITADAISKTDLTLEMLPDDLKGKINKFLPARWSKSNPIDLAGGETRDTIPELLSVILGHDQVDSLIFLGLGVQGNVARSYFESAFANKSTNRMAAFHTAQEERYAEAVIKNIKEFNKPIFVATELAIADPTNPGPETLRNHGNVIYRSPITAVQCLAALTEYGAFLNTE